MAPFALPNELVSEEFQVDFEIFRNRTSQRIQEEKLINVSSLRNAFELFGVKKDDRVDTRDMVLMTSIIEEEMKKARRKLLERKEYDAAAKIRDRLKSINEEFRQLQKRNELIRQQQEKVFFEKASKKAHAAVDDKAKIVLEKTKLECNRKLQDLARLHEIQKEQLEEYLQNKHKPPVRYSKGLIDMMHSERHLARLDQFEEAKSMRKRVQALQPEEIQMHMDSIQNRYNKIRQALESRHSFELRKMQEKVYDIQLRGERQATKLSNQLTMRLKHHDQDMDHKHALDRKTDKLFCAVVGGKVRPVTKTRKGYKATDATFRGTQLLTVMQGDAIKGIPSLCEIHDFENQDKGVFEYKG